MTKTQIVYDNDGYIYSIKSGVPAPRNPVGVPYLNIDIPEGYRIKEIDGIGVDTSSTPHQVIFEKIPPTELEKMRTELDDAILELTMLIYGGGL